MTKIKVKPIDTAAWHGKKGYESFRKPKTIQALINSRTQTYSTGLDNRVLAYSDPEDNTTDEKTLTEKEYYEKLLKVDLSEQFVSERPHPFWDAKIGQVKLENRTMHFDPSIPLDYIKIRILKTSKFVANSVEDYNNGFFPEATHIIFDEEENIEEKASKIALRNTAIQMCAKLTKEQKVSLVTVLSLVDSEDYYKASRLANKSENFIDVELNKYIEKYPAQVIQTIKEGKDKVQTESMVINCLQAGIFKKEGHRILYFESVLGQSIKEVTDYLLLDKNQDLKIRLVAELNKK